jgi:hypothetical protein
MFHHSDEFRNMTRAHFRHHPSAVNFRGFFHNPEVKGDLFVQLALHHKR